MIAALALAAILHQDASPTPTPAPTSTSAPVVATPTPTPTQPPMTTLAPKIVQTAPTPTPAPAPAPSYTTVVWLMPSWVDATTPTWPQKIVSSTVETSPVFGVPPTTCGNEYQVDIYNTSATTSALIAGGTLSAPQSPAEDLIAGGWGTAYELVQNAACVVTPPPVTTPPATAPPMTTLSPKIGHFSSPATVSNSTPTSSANLADTGSAVAPWQVWGAALLAMLIGGLAIFGSMKRKQDRK